MSHLVFCCNNTPAAKDGFIRIETSSQRFPSCWHLLFITLLIQERALSLASGASPSGSVIFYRNHVVDATKRSAYRFSSVFPDVAVVSTVTSAERRSTTSRWTSGTLDKIAKTSAWKTWSTGCGPRPWSLKVVLLGFRTLLLCLPELWPAPLPQVALLRASWCRDTWSISLCRFSLWSTATSSSVHATPTWRGGWTRMNWRWMRWPKPCCTSPKRNDCSRPRGASPYPRGSTSSCPRSSWQPIAPAPQRRKPFCSDSHTPSHPGPLAAGGADLVQGKTVRARTWAVPGGGQCDLSSTPARFKNSQWRDCGGRLCLFHRLCCLCFHF